MHGELSKKFDDAEMPFDNKPKKNKKGEKHQTVPLQLLQFIRLFVHMRSELSRNAYGIEN